MTKVPAKILLFGEYSILRESNALAMPFFNFHGQLAKTNKKPDPRFLDYFEFLKNTPVKELLDMKKLEEDIKEGLIFESDIPEYSGLGSSGALTAVVFKNYQQEPVQSDLDKTREILATMESFFHGQSSGLDPLVSFYSKIVLKKDRQLSLLDPGKYLQASPLELFIIDSGIKSATGNFVEEFNHFLQANNSLSQTFDEIYSPLVNEAIQAFLEGKEELPGLVKRIGHWQLTFFPMMIPERIKKLYQEGFDSGDYYLKLCGSGGGGHFLGFTKNREVVASRFEKENREGRLHFLAPVLFEN